VNKTLAAVALFVIFAAQALAPTLASGIANSESSSGGEEEPAAPENGTAAQPPAENATVGEAPPGEEEEEGPPYYLWRAGGNYHVVAGGAHFVFRKDGEVEIWDARANRCLAVEVWGLERNGTVCWLRHPAAFEVRPAGRCVNVTMWHIKYPWIARVSYVLGEVCKSSVAATYYGGDSASVAVVERFTVLENATVEGETIVVGSLTIKLPGDEVESVSLEGSTVLVRYPERKVSMGGRVSVDPKYELVACPIKTLCARSPQQLLKLVGRLPGQHRKFKYVRWL